MQKFKIALMATMIMGLFACTPSQSPKITQHKPQVGYLKENISQTELNNPKNYKRYSYYCKNFATGGSSYLATYFPLWSESRKQENFGIYFQLDGGKPYPFDHIANINLNARGTKFEVRYRSYQPIEGGYVELMAREFKSVYYKHNLPWLECREG
ncbi:hypothetical protein CT138_04465 [Mannheimia varigena]|uniref:hypothetical protein n=1 Tax=Mannheimia varigena TaxID=85404 RepID=UPI000DBF06FF|nr:hypothetical protein [Mannheimia varigena]AWW34144.1 hypothetical protein CT138_04465 [Mannheimia varigena]MDY2946390.1 hypothetical protein [Mannheimia varigena]QLD33638.1 hypothetical protein A6B42_07620 [Mannheimia varigena]